MKKLTLAIVAGLFSVTGALAQTEEPLREGHLNLLDRNDSGAVNRTEYQQFMTEAFARLDTDGSGYLTQSDIDGILTAEQFAQLDMNGDGRVTQVEFMAQVMADFDLADEGGTGRLE